MDFTHTEIQTMLADSVGKFINNEYDFDTRQGYAGSDQGYSEEVWSTFAELGWTAVPFTEEDGGFGGGPTDVMVLMQSLAPGLVVEPYLANIILAGGILRRAASPEQKERWLQAIIGGELQATLAFNEPQARYDLASVHTTATPDGDGWVLNGTKGLVPNGGTADLLIVPARTSGATVEEDGITLFAIDANAAGMSRNAYATVDGLRAAEIMLDGVRADADAVIGEVGKGFAALDATIDDATLAVCAEAVGIMYVLKDKTVEYSKSRKQFGVPIGSFQELQHRMVDMLMACEQAQSLLMWSVMKRDAEGDDCKRAVNSIKYLIGTEGKKLGEDAVQIHGGMGVTWDLDVAHYFKRLTTIGTLFGNADWHLDKLADTAPQP
ncbi:MAG: acyl-CoA dehydrogenase family protein [Gammaproteobacteria bacterium]|nr:acyl-CoA dehydrogenase family protein [Gammaproteobacteria bacterium]